MCTLLFFNIENDVKNHIFIVIFIVIVLGVNRALPQFTCSLVVAHFQIAQDLWLW